MLFATFLLLAALHQTSSLSCYFCEHWVLGGEDLSLEETCIDKNVAVECSVGQRCNEGNIQMTFLGQEDELVQYVFTKGCVSSSCEEDFANPDMAIASAVCNERLCDTDFCNNMTQEEATNYSIPRPAGEEKIPDVETVGDLSDDVPQDDGGAVSQDSSDELSQDSSSESSQDAGENTERDSGDIDSDEGSSNEGTSGESVSSNEEQADESDKEEIEKADIAYSIGENKTTAESSQTGVRSGILTVLLAVLVAFVSV